jgi:hypothetical protein
VLFDVRLQGKEILIDEGGDFRIGVGLGFQPSASASGRGRAEINEQRLSCGLGLGERRVGILFPFDCHIFTSSEIRWNLMTNCRPERLRPATGFVKVENNSRDGLFQSLARSYCTGQGTSTPSVFAA